MHMNSVVDPHHFNANPDPDFYFIGNRVLIFIWCGSEYLSLLCTLYSILPVLWIRDILVPIRIRGSVPLTSGSGSCFFRQWLTSCQQKISYLFKVFFPYYFLKLYFHQSSKIKIKKKSQNSRNQVFLLVSYLFQTYGSHGSDPDPLYSVGSSTVTVP